jgi:hypothetical protein
VVRLAKAAAATAKTTAKAAVSQYSQASQKAKLYLGVGVVVLIVVVGIAYVQLTKQPEGQQYQTPAPEEVVRQYFTAWNSKDWPNMYATISDGFKRIDSNAKDLATFRSFASTQGVEGVSILSLTEGSNDGKTAIVAYSIEFTLGDVSKRKFDDEFTLKYRAGDIIPGWKLIHPYGPNIDTS